MPSKSTKHVGRRETKPIFFFDRAAMTNAKGANQANA
jgi:hypothetical protein